MDCILKISEAIGTDIRSRSAATVIYESLNVQKQPITLDFSGVSFISRSFADELCIVMGQYANVSIHDMIPAVKNMLDVVMAGRSKTRIRKRENVIVKDFDNIKELSAFMRNKL